MRILVYGAGNIGSIYAGLLARAGNDVAILARGSRVDRIRERGIDLRNFDTNERIIAHPGVVDRLRPDDFYDLVMVTLGREHVADVLPALAESRGSQSVMFMGNNCRGPQQMIDALGRERVLLGFPGAAGVPDGGAIRYVITPSMQQPTTIGELDGERSTRIRSVEKTLRSAGFSAAICGRMDAWLKTHVAEISPMANAIYMAGGEPQRLAASRYALLLLVRAIREGYRVLRASGIPIMPFGHRVFRWLPEPLLVGIMKRAVASKSARIKLGHALAARGEMALLAEDFAALAAQSAVPTPSLEELVRYVDPAVEPLAAGRTVA